jgi:hypothetical protein
MLNMGVSDHPVESPAQPARASTGQRAHPPKRGGSWGELAAVFCYLGFATLLSLSLN